MCTNIPVNGKGLMDIESRAIPKYTQTNTYKASEHTSWPDKWIQSHSALRTRLQYLEQPRRSRPSRHHLHVPRAALLNPDLQCQSNSERYSERETLHQKYHFREFIFICKYTWHKCTQCKFIQKSCVYRVYLMQAGVLNVIRGHLFFSFDFNTYLQSNGP